MDGKLSSLSDDSLLPRVPHTLSGNQKMTCEKGTVKWFGETLGFTEEKDLICPKGK
jgi:hypothetical protein